MIGVRGPGQRWSMLYLRLWIVDLWTRGFERVVGISMVCVVSVVPGVNL